MSKLEKFIDKNRDEFDSEEMNESVWTNVKSSIGSAKGKVVSFKLTHIWLAASVIIIPVLAGIIYYTVFRGNTSTSSGSNSTVTLPPKQVTDDVDTSYTAQLYQFVQIIESKQNELKKDQKTHPVLYDQFLKDGHQLDSSYNYLKSGLSSNPNKEVLINAMIQNLQLKIDLLNRQLQIIKQSKQKTKNYESKTI